MLAIPVFRARVAPVLDWCSKIIIIPLEGGGAASGRQMEVMEDNVFALMRTLRAQGIKTLICGALSPETLNYGESIGLEIIHGIAGEIEEIVVAYRENQLDLPKYWLPGCRGPRRYKGGTKCVGKGRAPAGNGPGSQRLDKAAGGPGGFCVCPECGSKVRHERGIPCSQIQCRTCRVSMCRE